MSSYTKKYAETELNILVKSCDSSIKEFIPEILALCDKFGNSGQSGGSAPFVAKALAQTIEELCLQKPICDITGLDEEWPNPDVTCGGTMFQNIRLSSVFKKSKEGRPYYLDAVVFKGENGSCFTSGSVSLKDGSTIGSRQFIRLPFKPKTFYIDVIETEWADKSQTVKKEGGGWWTSIIKDESQLEEVFEYYDRYSDEKA